MAKSIRSKWKRKMRAVKRERYGKKELEKLKAVVAKDPLHPARAPKDIDLHKLSDIATVVDKKDVVGGGEAMDDGRRVFNPTTLRDQHGTYPAWVGCRRRRRLIYENRKAKRQRTKATKKAKKKGKK